MYIKNAIDFIFLKTGSRFEKVKLADINFLKADGSYTKFITSSREYTLSNSLNNIASQINSPSFIRIHRSFVINLDNVTGLNNDYVFFGEENIPISRNHKEDVARILKKIS
ncbi:LytR/AlgR family response regulator transcription factor [Ekhidna sp.]|uniref:LytR/AlgR family response regulator transcription factor n=1 Tax=Ekhidna sp. TaxID=2608089 RepID=UPI003CCC365B